jgi:threonine/homoserine/homoserine lactone efflux protein
MLGVSDYGTFVITILVFLLIPGPGNLALVLSTSKGGVRGGLAATLGVILGDQMLLWLAVAGVAALLSTHPGAFEVLQWVGASYLAWLGGSMLTSKAGAPLPIDIRPRQYLRQALLITLFNPKAILFYLAFFPLFVDPVHQQGVMTYGFMAATIATLTFAYGLGATLLTHFFAERVRANPVIGRVLEKVAGLLLIGFGLKLVASQ